VPDFSARIFASDYSSAAQPSSASIIFSPAHGGILIVCSITIALNSRASDALAWAPQIPLSDGLARTIEYFEELLADDVIRQAIIHEAQGAET